MRTGEAGTSILPRPVKWDLGIEMLLGRTTGEQNIFCNTNMYVHGVQGQQTKGVRGIPGGERGLDKVCYGESGLA